MDIDYDQWAYCANEGLKNLKVLDSKLEFKKWHFEKAECEKSFKDRNFWHIIPSKYYENQKVPLNKVVGTSHINYQGKMWLEVLGCLKRFDHYSWDKATFLDKYKSFSIGYMKYGDNYFIGEGNHRITIAKFLEFDYLEAPVTEYFFDYEFYNTYQELSNLNLQPNLSSYWRESPWSIKICDKSIHLQDFSLVKSFLAYYNEIALTFKSLLQRKYRNFFENIESSYFIRKVEDMDNIFSLIIDHKIMLSESGLNGSYTKSKE
jgi:hypothetical protein